MYDLSPRSGQAVFGRIIYIDKKRSMTSYGAVLHKLSSKQKYCTDSPVQCDTEQGRKITHTKQG